MRNLLSVLLVPLCLFFPVAANAQVAFRTGGDGIWAAVPPPAGLQDLLSISSPALDVGQSAWVEIDVTGPARVDFFCDFSWDQLAEPYRLKALFMMLDGGDCATFHGNSNESVSVEVGEGAHVLRWLSNSSVPYGNPAALHHVWGVRVVPLTGTPMLRAITPAGSTPPASMAWVSRREITEIPPAGEPGSQTWTVVGGAAAPDGVAALRSTEPEEGVHGNFSFLGPGVVEVRVEHSARRWDPESGEFYLLPDGGFFDLLTNGEVHTVLPPRTYVFPVGNGRHHFQFYPGDGDTTLDNAIVHTGPYAAWLTGLPAMPGQADPAADPDGDGIPNLAEYAFGLDPSQAGPADTVISTAENGDLQLSVPRPAYNISPLTYIVETSADLGSWTPHPEIIPANPAHGNHLVFTFPTPAPRLQGFARVRVKMAP